MGELLVGTSGYDYPEWKGVFYPQNCRREDFLGHYAGVFNALELNFSYYQMPTEYQLEKMVEKTGGRVRFSIKGNRSFTHDREAGLWREQAREFRRRLYPFVNAQVLAAILLQFPQSFAYSPKTRSYLAELLSEFEGLPLTAEFRHDSWQKDSVYTGLHERNTAYCITDMPALSRLPQFRPVVTAGAAYLRFHGKNKANWYGTNARDRYAYGYSKEELEEFVPVIRGLLNRSKIVQIFFNNHADGQAAENARQLKTLLEAGL